MKPLTRRRFLGHAGGATMTAAALIPPSRQARFRAAAETFLRLKADKLALDLRDRDDCQRGRTGPGESDDRDLALSNAYLDAEEILLRLVVTHDGSTEEAEMSRPKAVRCGRHLFVAYHEDAVEIDVAVTVNEAKSAGGGGGITVLGIGAKGEGKFESSSSTVSRVKFRVPICYPTVGANPQEATWGPGFPVRF